VSDNRTVAVCSRTWPLRSGHERGGAPGGAPLDAIDATEGAFVRRMVAGAIARAIGALRTRVVVPSPGLAASGAISVADGAFDVEVVGGVEGMVDSTRTWVLFDTEDASPRSGPGLRAGPAGNPSACLLGVLPAGAALPPSVTLDAWLRLSLAEERVPRVHDVGLFVPVNHSAASERFLGVDGQGAIVILCGDDDGRVARQVLMRFADRKILTVYEGRTTLWQAGEPMATAPVATRADLWRLMAHASIVADLSPGPLVARECIESALLGTPVVAPAIGPAGHHASVGGILAYRPYWQGDKGEEEDRMSLFSAIESLDDPAVRDEAAARAHAWATSTYGNAAAFVERIADALA